jgi:hypothetical protein
MVYPVTQYRLYQGVLYFQNVIGFYSAHVNVRPQEKCGLSSAIFAKRIKAEQYHVQLSYTTFHPNRTLNVESTDTNSVKYGFPRNTNLSINCCGYSFHRILSKSEDNVDNRQHFVTASREVSL